LTDPSPHIFLLVDHSIDLFNTLRSRLHNLKVREEIRHCGMRHAVHRICQAIVHEHHAFPKDICSFGAVCCQITPDISIVCLSTMTDESDMARARLRVLTAGSVDDQPVSRSGRQSSQGGRDSEARGVSVCQWL
jgi:hypothetical protein